MAQLGRVKSPIAGRVFAAELCRRKPATAVALRLIRRWCELFRFGMALYLQDQPETLKLGYRIARRVVRETEL